MLFRYFPVISSELFPAIITHVDQRRPALPELFVICPCVSLCLSLSPKLERVLRHCIDEQPGALLDINQLLFPSFINGCQIMVCQDPREHSNEDKEVMRGKKRVRKDLVMAESGNMNDETFQCCLVTSCHSSTQLTLGLCVHACARYHIFMFAYANYSEFNQKT